MDRWFGSGFQRSVSLRFWERLHEEAEFEDLVEFAFYLLIINARDWPRTKFWMRINNGFRELNSWT
jgi:hypothetical protein